MNLFRILYAMILFRWPERNVKDNSNLGIIDELTFDKFSHENAGLSMYVGVEFVWKWDNFVIFVQRNYLSVNKQLLEYIYWFLGNFCKVINWLLYQNFKFRTIRTCNVFVQAECFSFLRVNNFRDKRWLWNPKKSEGMPMLN